MKHRKEVTRTYTTVEIETTVCDLCKEEIRPAAYQIDETIIKYKYGCCYPEGGTAVVKEFDLCADCFEDKLIPWFKEHGVEPQVYEEDY